LLASLIEPTEGVILFDRRDLKELNFRDVRRQIGIVLQDNHIFSESITRNIAFGDPEPDFDRVLWCAQVANAHDFIMRMPMGYETSIGETGIALSGGQKQRVAIARALYTRNPGQPQPHDGRADMHCHRASPEHHSRGRHDRRLGERRNCRDRHAR
jgi:ABC-type bacteriocin/lantibiotic exporter with double-glycine peptidase domain